MTDAICKAGGLVICTWEGAARGQCCLMGWQSGAADGRVWSRASWLLRRAEICRLGMRGWLVPRTDGRGERAQGSMHPPRLGHSSSPSLALESDAGLIRYLQFITALTFNPLAPPATRR